MVKRTLTTKVFNAMLYQECVAAEQYFKDEVLTNVAPTVLRAIYLTDIIGDDPYVQTLQIDDLETQPGILAEAAESVEEKYSLAGLLYMTSVKFTERMTGAEELKMMISGQTTDGKKNLAVYNYDIDEDGRYYIKQEVVIPYSATSDLQTEVPAIDAFIKAYNKHRFSGKMVK